MAGPTAGQAFVVTRDRATRVGRSRDAEIKLDEEGVSRDHAVLAWEADQLWITDLGSRNGTTVDEHLISKCPLGEGAEVRFGARTLFRLTFIDEQYEALLRQLYDSSVRDPLTGAYNRQYFDQRLRTEIAYATRHGTDVALCMIDLDHFKKINDAFGHPAGDAVLRYVGAVAQSRLRNEDVFARYGGEEFAVILRGIDIDGAARAAERLRGAIGGSAVTHEGRLIPATMSAGCATLRCCSAPRTEELVSTADRRLYAAKTAGRNRVVATDG
jgi:diguanylate cyclase (GGDEF)-like protein